MTPSFLLFLPALVGRQVLAPGDGYQVMIPWRTFAAEQWRAGRVPGWSPYLFSGFPLLAAQQAAVFYPPTWLYIVLPVTLATNAVVVLHFAVAAIGAALLARRLLEDDVAAVVTGVAFGTCGFLFAHVGHPGLLSAAAWLPWPLLGAELLRERVTPLRVAATAVPLALSLLAGHSQLAFFVIANLVAYVVVLAALERRNALRTLAATAGAIAVAAGLAAVQLVPTALYVPLSARSHFDFSEAVSFSLPVSHLPLLLFPYLFGTSVPTGPITGSYAGAWNLTELTGYPGAAALVLAGAGLTVIRRDRRFLALAIVALGAGLTALGDATPVGALVHRLPVFGQFRAWARYLVTPSLVVALLAGAGVQQLRAATGRTAAARRAAVTAGLVAAVGLVAPNVGQVARSIPDEGNLLVTVGTPLLFAVLAAVLAAGVAHWRRAALAGALVAVVALDGLLSFGAFYEWRRGSPSPATVTADRNSQEARWGEVGDAPGGIDRFMFLGGDIHPLGRDTVSLTDYMGLRSASGADPLAPRHYTAMASSMTSFGATGDPTRAWKPGSDILDLLRVSTVLVDPESSLHGPPDEGPWTEPTWTDGRLVRYDRVPTLDDAWLVGRVEPRTTAEIHAAVDGTTPFAPADVALTDDRCQGCPTGPPGRAGSVRSREWEADRVRFALEADRPALLVVSQAWMEGWTAEVDGEATGVHRVDGALQGVTVPAGRHEVVLRYRTPGLRTGAAVSAVTLAGLLGWALVDRRRRRPG